jgi:hypothetical protein
LESRDDLEKDIVITTWCVNMDSKDEKNVCKSLSYKTKGDATKHMIQNRE